MLYPKTTNQLKKIRKNRHVRGVGTGVVPTLAQHSCNGIDYPVASIIRTAGTTLQITKYPDKKSIFNKMNARRVTDSPSHVAALAKSSGNRTCPHGRFQPYCKACKGSMLCVHLRHKNRCAACRRYSAMSTSASGGNSGVVFQ